jgi:thiamine-phosphate pyrophosphorylase
MTGRYRKNLPLLWLMTDERVPAGILLASVARLPRGRAGIVFRHYDTAPAERRMLFDRIAAIARKRRLTVLLGGTARDAAAWGADGWHGRDVRRRAQPMAHSMPAHDALEMAAAHRAGADMLFLSPLFPTRSHAGAPALGRARFAGLARRATIAVIALGGMTADRGDKVRLLGASGWAAIDGLTVRSSNPPDR